MKMIYLALIVQFFINFASGHAFVITRASHGRDAFKIPASIGRDCEFFYAVDGARDSSCICPAKNATFAYHDRQWSCVENRKLRRRLNRGKRILFIEKINQTLRSKSGLFKMGYT